MVEAVRDKSAVYSTCENCGKEGELHVKYGSAIFESRDIPYTFLYDPRCRRLPITITITMPTSLPTNLREHEFQIMMQDRIRQELRESDQYYFDTSLDLV